MEKYNDLWENIMIYGKNIMIYGKIFNDLWENIMIYGNVMIYGNEMIPIFWFFVYIFQLNSIEFIQFKKIKAFH